jgi:hypothetical protein
MTAGIERPVRAVVDGQYGFAYLVDATGRKIATIYGSAAARRARAMLIAAAVNRATVADFLSGELATEMAPPAEPAAAETKEQLAAEILARFRPDRGAWRIDGRAVRGDAMRLLWRRLDWQQARLDWGPSPAGNPGPYWHVPMREPPDDITLRHGWEGTVHRLYPLGRRADEARALRVAELKAGR